MKLTDLNPRWLAEAGRQGQAVTFECPCCIGTKRAARLCVAFQKPVDAGTPISLKPGDLWPLLAADAASEQERQRGTVPPGVHWAREGDTFDGLTVKPSVDASGSGHWHGFITNGEAS